ncbi:MAG: serine kinase [Pseudomonadota bacterium]
MISRATGTLFHASAVDIGGQGVLILGQAGAGKSTLALELLSRGAALVADDQTRVLPGDPPRLCPPQTTAGLIEARGVGLLHLPCIAESPVALIVDLDRHSDQRLPAPRTLDLLGSQVDAIFGKGLPTLAATVIMTLKGRWVDPDTHPAAGTS